MNCIEKNLFIFVQSKIKYRKSIFDIELHAQWDGIDFAGCNVAHVDGGVYGRFASLVKLPLKSELSKTRVVKSEFPGVIFLRKFETHFRSEFLGCEVVGDLGSHDLTTILVVEEQRSICNCEYSLSRGTGVHKSTPLRSLVEVSD